MIPATVRGQIRAIRLDHGALRWRLCRTESERVSRCVGDRSGKGERDTERIEPLRPFRTSRPTMQNRRFAKLGLFEQVMNVSEGITAMDDDRLVQLCCEESWSVNAAT